MEGSVEAVAGLDKLKGRYIVMLLALSTFVLPFVLDGLLPGSQLPWYWVELGFVYPIQLALVAFVVAAGFVVGLDFRQLFGPLPDRKGWRLLVHVDLLLFGLGSALLFAIYLPLSYVVPGFVRWWLDWAFMPSVYLEADGSLPLLANILSWISVVVLAPLLEELLFRGFLLHRWAAKWGMNRGILASSLLFGVLHPDPAGAAIFGVGMCLLYLRTRALWVPILAHALYNGSLWVWELYGVLAHGADYYIYDLAQFRGDWMGGVIGVVVALAAAAVFLRQRSPEVRRTAA